LHVPPLAAVLRAAPISYSGTIRSENSNPTQNLSIHAGADELQPLRQMTTSIVPVSTALVPTPEGAICLLSALAFHEMTTQSPASVWIALRKGARTPALVSPSLRIVRLSGASLTRGIEDHTIEGVQVRVYSAAKTVADCFKFRNKIGLDVAIEALKDCLRQKKANVSEIYCYAKVCRVSNVIRPYMEAL